eukprot:1030985-Prymnesium_polylepis.1
MPKLGRVCAKLEGEMPKSGERGGAAAAPSAADEGNTPTGRRLIRGRAVGRERHPQGGGRSEGGL